MTAVRPSASAKASYSGIRFAFSFLAGLNRSSGYKPLSGSANTRSQAESAFLTRSNQARRQLSRSRTAIGVHRRVRRQSRHCRVCRTSLSPRPVAFSHRSASSAYRTGRHQDGAIRRTSEDRRCGDHRPLGRFGVNAQIPGNAQALPCADCSKQSVLGKIPMSPT